MITTTSRQRQKNSPIRFVRRSLLVYLSLLLTLSWAKSFQQQHSTSTAAEASSFSVGHNTVLSSPAAAPPTTTGYKKNSEAITANDDHRRKHKRRRGSGFGRLSLPLDAKVSPVSTTPTNRKSTKTLKQSSSSGSGTAPSPLIPVVDDATNAEYQRRKEEWARRYTRLDGLRQAFGSNKNKLWGDLDATTSRRLYKSLLPNALCELVLELGMRPEELAPLAYEARKAAKLYARERCHLPARVAANLFDGYRQWKRYGRFQMDGMSYDQIWDKYRNKIMNETVVDNRPDDDTTRAGKALTGSRSIRLSENNDDAINDDNWTEEDIVVQTCLKILEKSCKTNERIDRMLLRPTRSNATGSKSGSTSNANSNASDQAARDQLIRVAKTLEDDVRKLLDPTGFEDQYQRRGSNEEPDGRSSPLTQRQYHALKHFALTRRRILLDAMEADVLLPGRLWNSTTVL